MHSNNFSADLAPLPTVLWGSHHPAPRLHLGIVASVLATCIALYAVLWITLVPLGHPGGILFFSAVGLLLGFLGHRRRRTAFTSRMLVITGIPVALTLLFWFVSVPGGSAKVVGFFLIPTALVGSVLSGLYEHRFGTHKKTLQRLWRGVSSVGSQTDQADGVSFFITTLTEALPRREIRRRIPHALSTFAGQPRRSFPFFTTVACIGAFGLWLIVQFGIVGELTSPTENSLSQILGMSAMITLLGYGVFVTGFFGRAERSLPTRTDLVRFTGFIEQNAFLGPQSYVDRDGIVHTSVLTSTTHPAAPFQVTNTSTREARTIYGAQFAGTCIIRTNTPLPHIRLLSQRRAPSWFSTIELPSPDQHLSLEGDFDKHFQLFCPAGYETDALYLFTPDVLAELIDDVEDFDIEFVDDRIVIHSRGPMVTLNPGQWHRVARAITMLQRRVDQWGRWRDARVDAGPTVFAPLRVAEKGVAQQGRRLRKVSMHIVTIALIYTGIYLGLTWLANLV